MPKEILLDRKNSEALVVLSLVLVLFLSGCTDQAVNKTIFTVYTDYSGGIVLPKNITADVTIPLDRSEAQKVAEIALETPVPYTLFSDLPDPFIKTDYGWNVTLWGGTAEFYSYLLIYENNIRTSTSLYPECIDITIDCKLSHR